MRIFKGNMHVWYAMQEKYDKELDEADKKAAADRKAAEQCVALLLHTFDFGGLIACISLLVIKTVLNFLCPPPAPAICWVVPGHPYTQGQNGRPEKGHD
jgi:hypothetical protein